MGGAREREPEPERCGARGRDRETEAETETESQSQRKTMPAASGGADAAVGTQSFEEFDRMLSQQMGLQESPQPQPTAFDLEFAQAELKGKERQLDAELAGEGGSSARRSLFQRKRRSTGAATGGKTSICAVRQSSRQRADQAACCSALSQVVRRQRSRSNHGQCRSHAASRKLPRKHRRLSLSLSLSPSLSLSRSSVLERHGRASRATWRLGSVQAAWASRPRVTAVIPATNHRLRS